MNKEKNKKGGKFNIAQKPLIIFAIPTYNEVENIGHLTHRIDQGIQRYFKKADCLIVNVDNDSPDGTKKAFLGTPTKNKKIYLTTKGKPKSVRGKGFQMRMALQLAKKMKATAIGFIDGDVSSVKPEWTKNLVYPLLEGYDTVLPVYLRNEYDGSITNHFIFPVLYGLILTNIRQPIAGEIGLSSRAIDLLLSEKWPESANRFGVDIYLLTQIIFHNLSITQILLGVKEHKPSAPKLDSMFIQVADSFISQLIKYRHLWKNKNWQGRKIPVLKREKDELPSNPPKLPFNYKEMKERLLEEYQKIKPEINGFFGKNLGEKIKTSLKNNKIDLKKGLWVEAVYKVISRNRQPNKQELLILRVIFFARFLTFYKEVLEKNYQESEKEIISQAKLFRRKRSLVLGKNINGKTRNR